MPGRSRPDPRKANGWRRNQLIARVRAAYDTCSICGRPVDKTIKWPNPWCGVVDETIPVSKGGSPCEWNNLALAHKWCNEIKSDKTLEWAQTEVQRILTGQGRGTQTRPTAIPFRRLDI